MLHQNLPAYDIGIVFLCLVIWRVLVCSCVDSNQPMPVQMGSCPEALDVLTHPLCAGAVKAVSVLHSDGYKNVGHDKTTDERLTMTALSSGKRNTRGGGLPG